MPPKAEADKAAKDKKAGKDAPKAPEPKPEPKPLTPLEVLQRNLVLLDKYVDSRDRRFLVRVMRYSGFVRQYIAEADLVNIINSYVTDSSRKELLLEVVRVGVASRKTKSVETQPPTAATPAASASSETASSAASAASTAATGASSSTATAGGASAGTAATPAASPAATPAAPAPPVVKLPKVGGASAVELEAYLHVLGLTMVQGAELAATGILARAAAAVHAWMATHNRRALDFFTARVISLLALAHERAGGLEAFRPFLIAAHRTATLRHDEFGQAALINLVLRSFIQARAYEQAHAFVSKTSMPEAASNNQLVRYLYYTGRIHAIQLSYSAAYAALQQAARKAPPAALGFRAAVTRLSVVVQLLMGELPEHSLFASKVSGLGSYLKPYLALTQAVRSGNVGQYKAVVAQHSAAFTRDATLSLVRRLESSVIKSGLRTIAASYSCISFADVAAKLQLGSAEDAEFLAAKAIHDGVIDAVLDHGAGTMSTAAAANVYLTAEPRDAFHRRITFCMDVHNEAVKAMRYPAQALREELESAEVRREREAEENELINELEKEGFDDDDDDE